MNIGNPYRSTANELTEGQTPICDSDIILPGIHNYHIIHIYNGLQGHVYTLVLMYTFVDGLSLAYQKELYKSVFLLHLRCMVQVSLWRYL